MLRKLLHTFGTRTFSAVINLAVAILLSRYLGPEGKGSQSIILTTISFILIFSNLAGGATLVYLAPRYSTRQLLVPSYAWSVLMSLVSLGLLSLTGWVEDRYILHVCALAVINSVMSIHSNLLLGKQKIRESNTLAWLQSVILLLSLLIFFLILRTWTVQSYILSLYGALGITMLISIWYIRGFFEPGSLFPLSQYIAVLTRMFSYGIQNQVAHITQMLSFRLSFYVLEEYKGIASVGIYSNGISIAESIWLVAKSMALVQYSWVSNSSDRQASARLTMQMVTASVLLSLFLMIPLLILPVSGYVAIFGPGFEGVKQVIWMLLPGVLIYNLSIIIGHYYSGTGRYFMNTRISSAGLAVSLILYSWLIPLLGAPGAGIATSISYAFTSLLFLWFFTRENSGTLSSFMPTAGEMKQMVKQLSRN